MIPLRFYAGVGSRRAPPSVEHQIREVAELLNDYGFILRSGAADGPDSWFEKYSKESQIFLPWRGFNGSDSILSAPTLAAYSVASEVYPAWDRLSDAAKALHARNAHQVLGPVIHTTATLVARPSEFVVCWTPGGKTVGGTATAIRIAQLYSIPVFNLANDRPGELFRTERVIHQIEALVRGS